MNYPKVFVIILNWNGLEDTIGCLESVYKLNYPNFEVIVVDNGSTDNSATVIREKFPEVIIIENKENLGFTGGNNIAMSYAMENGTDYVWLLNNDTVVEADTLNKLVETGENSPEVGILSPIIYYYEQPNALAFCGSYADWENHVIIYPEEKTLDVHNEFKNGKNVCLAGTAFLIKSEVIRKIGYLDEKFFAYWEDTEYSMRSIKAGFRNALEVNARIHHKTPLDWLERMGRRPYYFYFMARNEYFTWFQYLGTLEKFSFLRKYFAKRIADYGDLKKSGYDECANASFNGTWSAISNVGGPWVSNVRMPSLVKRILLWHPYLWKNLLEGNLSYIIWESFQRLRLRYL